MHPQEGLEDLIFEVFTCERRPPKIFFWGAVVMLHACDIELHKCSANKSKWRRGNLLLCKSRWTVRKYLDGYNVYRPYVNPVEGFRHLLRPRLPRSGEPQPSAQSKNSGDRWEDAAGPGSLASARGRGRPKSKAGRSESKQAGSQDLEVKLELAHEKIRKLQEIPTADNDIVPRKCALRLWSAVERSADRNGC